MSFLFKNYSVVEGLHLFIRDHTFMTPLCLSLFPVCPNGCELPPIPVDILAKNWNAKKKTKILSKA